MGRRRVATAAAATEADGWLADQWLTDSELGLQRGGTATATATATATGAAQGRYDDTTMSQLICAGGGERAPQGQRRASAGAGGSSVRN